MIPVTLLDIVVPDPEKEPRILVLTEESRRRLLAIWIGPHEADDIALNLLGKKVYRPMTFSLMASLLDKAGVQIESVTVSALEKDTFYATVHAQSGEESFTIDARPSDAIALALRTQSPIFVAVEVMDAAAEKIPDDMEVGPQGQGLNDVLKAGRAVVSREDREKWESMSPEERSKESRKKLLTYLQEAGCLTRIAQSADE